MRDSSVRRGAEHQPNMFDTTGGDPEHHDPTERVRHSFGRDPNTENAIDKPDSPTGVGDVRLFGSSDHLVALFGKGFGQSLVTHVLNGPGYDEYVGRENHRHKLKESYFHNPFEIGKDGTREEVLDKYERYLYEVLLATEEGRRRLEDLRGKILACWCAGKDGAPLLLSKDDSLHCHGQILLRALWGAKVSLLDAEEQL